jgi:hypothetical protein
MGQKRYIPEKIIGILKETEVRLSQGEKVKGNCRRLAKIVFSLLFIPKI